MTSAGIVNQLLCRRLVRLLPFDASVWIFAVPCGALARLDLEPSNVRRGGNAAVAIAATSALALAARTTQLHSSPTTLGSLDEIILLGTVTYCVGVLIFFANPLTFTAPLPRSLRLIATLCAIVVMARGPAMERAILENAPLENRTQRGLPDLVVGAGDGRQQSIKSMRNDPTSRWYLCVF